MWEKQDGIILLNRRKTAKYVKNNTWVTIINSTTFKLHDEVYFEATVNVDNPLDFGILVTNIFVPVYSYNKRSTICAKLVKDSIKLYVNGKISSIHNLSKYVDSSIHIAIRFKNASNSVTIVKEEITHRTVDDVEEDADNQYSIKQSIGYITDGNIDDNIKDDILIVNSDIENVYLPELTSDRILTIINSYKGDNDKKQLYIKTIFPYSINDKNNISMYYNNSLTLCGLHEMSKWFII